MQVCVCVWEGDRVYMKWRVIVPDCRAHSRHPMLSLQSQCSQCSNQKSGGFWRAANQYHKHHQGQRSDSLPSHTTSASHSQPFLLSISLHPPWPSAGSRHLSSSGSLINIRVLSLGLTCSCLAREPLSTWTKTHGEATKVRTMTGQTAGLIRARHLQKKKKNTPRNNVFSLDPYRGWCWQTGLWLSYYHHWFFCSFSRSCVVNKWSENGAKCFSKCHAD